MQEDVLKLSEKASAQLARLMQRADGDEHKVARVFMRMREDNATPQPRSGVRIKTTTKKSKDNGNLVSVLLDAMYPKTDADRVIAKMLNDDTGVAESREIKDGEDGSRMSSDDTIPPPYDLRSLSTMLTINVMHQACIEAKARDIVSNGYELVKSKVAESEKLSDVLWNEWRADAEHFLNTCSHSRMIKGAPVDVVLHALATDYLALGSCGFEVLRNKEGVVTAANHIPFSTMRVTREDIEDERGVRFVQIKGQTKNYFIEFGNKVKYANGFDPALADVKSFPRSPEQRSRMIAWNEDVPDPRSINKKELDPNKSATEFYMMARPPFIASQVYGTPSGLTAIAYILAQLEIDKYNIQFFSSKGVPQYACVLQGLEPPRKDTIETDADEEVSDPYTELENEINEFFTEKLVSADRSVMLITTFGQATAKFEKLSADKADAAFESYEKRAMEMIRLAHGVPGAAIGILDTANLGSGRDTVQMRRYYSHAILPDQRAFESMLNFILRVGTLNPWVEVKFKPVDFEDRDALSKLNLERFIAGAFSLDDYLTAEGLPTIGDENGGNLRIIRTSSVTVLNSNPDQASAALAKMQAKQVEAVRRIYEGVANYISDDEHTEAVDED